MIFFSAMIVDCMGLIYSMAIYLGEIGTECNTRWNGVHQFKREKLNYRDSRSLPYEAGS